MSDSSSSEYGLNDPFVQQVYENGPFGYQPQLAPAVIFSLAFALLGMGHAWKTWKSKHWWLISLTTGVWFEMIGNAL